MLYYEPIPLYEAYVFVFNLTNDFSTGAYLNKQMLRDPGSRREYLVYLDTLTQLEERLRSALTVDEDVFYEVCNAFKLNSGKKRGVQFKSADVCLFNIIVTDAANMPTDRQEFIEFLREREKKLPELIAEAFRPADEGADIADTRNLFGLINSSALPQNIKSLFCDAAANPAKYVSIVRDMMLALADEFEACRPIWRSLIAPYRDSYENYHSYRRLIDEKFSNIGQEGVRELDMYPSIVGYRFYLSHRMDEAAKKITCNVGVLYDVFISNANREANRASLVSRIMSVLGDQTRFNLFAKLADKSCYGRELSNEFGISPGTVSEHMGMLIGLDLIASKTDGKKTYYYLNYPKVRQFLELQKQIFLKNDPEEAEAAPPAARITEVPRAAVHGNAGIDRGMKD